MLFDDFDTQIQCEEESGHDGEETCGFCGNHLINCDCEDDLTGLNDSPYFNLVTDGMCG